MMTMGANTLCSKHGISANIVILSMVLHSPEFDYERMRLLPDTERTLWQGTETKLVEGPHLYKRWRLLSLFAAEGGTMYTHRESVARSRTLDALSFESMPHNPLISNFDSPTSYLQKQGHGAWSIPRRANGITLPYALVHGITP